MTELIVVYKIKAANSSDPKRSGGNSEKSDAFPAISTIIKASFRVLHEQEDSLLSPNDNLTLYDNPDLNNSIIAMYIAPPALPLHCNRNIDA